MNLKYVNNTYQNMKRCGFAENEACYEYKEILSNLKELRIIIDRISGDISVIIYDPTTCSIKEFPKDKFSKREIKEIDRTLSVMESRNIFINEYLCEKNKEYQIANALKSLLAGVGEEVFGVAIAESNCPNDLGLEEMDCGDTGKDCLACWKKILTKY